MTIQNNDVLLTNRGDTSYQIKYSKIKQDILNDVSAGINDAPSDGKVYGRQNSDWREIVHNPYSNADVDAHLNTNLANGGQILSWNGTDYQWVADQTGGGGGSSDASLVSYQYPSGVSRSVESRLTDYVSVKDFGAIGNGSANDTIAIQAAFDSVGASGMTLHFPAGTYEVSDKLFIRQSAPGLTIHLDGGATIKAASGFPQNKKLIEAQVSSGTDKVFTWTGGIVDGTRMPSKTGGAPDIFTVADANFKSVTFTNAQFIQNRATDNGSNPPNVGNGGDSCMFLAKAKNLYVNGCTFMGATDAGIYISGDSSGAPKGENCIISNCFFSYCREVGIITKREFKNHIFSGNVAESCGTGIATGAVTDSSDNVKPGLQCVITGNTVRNCTNSGINLRVSDHSVVSNNIVENPGLTLNSDGTQNSWTDNAAGIAIQGSVSVSVSGNAVFVGRDYSPPSNIYGIQLGNYYTNADRTEFVDSKYCMINGNSIARTYYGISDIGGSNEDPTSIYNIISYNNYRNVTVKIANKHNASFYQEVDMNDGRWDLGFGNEDIVQVLRPIPGRRGRAIFGNDSNDVDVIINGFTLIENDLTVNGRVNAENITGFSTALSGIRAAANDSYSDLQQFKDAIKQALEGLNDD